MRWNATLFCLMLAIACLFTFPTHAEPQPPTVTTKPAFPPELFVDGKILLRVHARGVQIYQLQKFDAGKLEWKLIGPEATFQGPNGVAGRHYAGPTWELTGDGSKVVGTKIAEVPSQDPDDPEHTAIPWLLLKAKSHDGLGLLTTVTFIQRINTTGGKAPAVGVAKEGDEIRIPYVADYIFYGPGATTRPAKN